MIKNPEISSLVPTLLMGLTDPNEYTKYSLAILLQVKGLWMNICLVYQFYFNLFHVTKCLLVSCTIGTYSS